jgi:hypothetical protein
LVAGRWGGVVVACALGLGVAACGTEEGAAGSGSATAAQVAQAPVDAGGTTIPAATTTPATPAPPATTPTGAPKVVQFDAPKRFWCLKADPGQAQVIVGWSVPTATDLVVLLDGKVLPQGLLDNPVPFAVVAGKPMGLGVTVVFGCKAGSRHTITMRWSENGGPATTRSVTVVKAAKR